MLNIVPVRCTEDKSKIIQALDPTKDCLLVSDLRSKFEWQNHYLESEGVLAEEFIFRPSDLWKKLASYHLSDYKIVSNEYIVSYLSSLVQDRDEEFLKAPSAAASLFSYLSQLSVVFEHPEGRELLKEWFKENLDAFLRWGHWFFIAEEIWLELKQRELVCSSWIPALLLGKESEIALHWNRPLTLDLLLELKFVEAELFVGLSKFVDVNVLLPMPDKSSDFELDFENYRPLMTAAGPDSPWSSYFDKTHTDAANSSKLCHAKRFSSSLSEIKDRIGEIRILLDQGTPPDKIAIVAPDIGDYWPVLRSYLDKEGVPCQRPYNTGVQSLPGVSRWLSNLKLGSQSWDREDLEFSLFRDTEPMISYPDFQKFYTKIYSDLDIHRLSPVGKHFEKSFLENKPIDRESFIVWALGQWKEKHYPSVLEQLIKSLITECPLYLKLYLRDWVQMLAKILARQEICIRPGVGSGVLCIDIVSLEYIDCDHVYVLGMSDSAFKKDSPLKAVGQRDILSLRSQTGFPLSPEENRSLEFYLTWNLRNSSRNYYFSFPVTDFMGAIHSPSIIWLDAKKSFSEETTLVDFPKPSRLDELQDLSSGDLSSLNSVRFSEVALVRDFGESIPSPVPLKRFSATGFRDFKECPFKFAARYFFNLRSLPPVDLDMDRMKNGSIIHRIFELALSQSLDEKDVSAQEQLVQSVLQEEENLGKSDFQDVDRYKAKYLEILNRFLRFEAEWKISFPETIYWKQELRVQVGWDKELSDFTTEATDEMSQFNGIIDRIDRSGSEISVIDYKNSGASYKNFAQWFAEDDYQLLFYTMILKKIYSEEDLATKAGIYYSVKPWQRHKGFIVDDAEPSFLPVSDKKRNKIKSSDLVQAEEQLRAMTADFVDRVEQGELGPEPKDIQKNCPTCDWRAICRAKHLS